ncbi:hypothetical protein PN465_04290 [Nodularia spumigena CS-584]|jgi:hypothetical protein|uniref:DUF6816 domain-containing protein n=3 Tax=Nodularia spumigena TaxID=70799 RepID=A0A2S0Q761_NODSP|nr:hypothetical protein [Nodularia spumigena]AHJ27172.1 hypothetical protein NSP_8240 [Nodularia spumigena CCY9414]AVZ30535.1 hypothetical protein BMF81_02189 [Nodularia spumigena UHCC 0039]EAW46011.1 hypothetical protein N9414_14147 [Nodularia spumigena CCY9414]MDB9381459.1 hypothetical protein [Nodularia spumigena CS-584]MEA5524886.1 hypothetical protein [Nodularia spumigena UHCC 0143]
MLNIRAIWSCCLIIFCLLGSSGTAKAGELSQRLANFPQWEQLTSVQPAQGDLVYPDWFAGSWEVTSTLVDLVAPLAPDIITPGFESNRQQLNQPVSFLVRFIPEKSPITAWKFIPKIVNKSSILVADRAFNSLNLARAYLGDEAVLSTKVDPESPNRQITFLRGDSQLISIVTARLTETTSNRNFITSEVFQQLFKGGSRPYFNTVESTTAYHQLSTSYPSIEADQVTAVYLSPQDPDYFAAASHPVALYRYRLEFSPTSQD